MSELEKQIEDKIGEVRTDALDMSFGEIASLHRERELIIRPEYQRLFRWSEAQQSRLIESVLLELPVPPIMVIEGVDGRYELIDGLQRISSVFHFMDPELLRGQETVRASDDATAATAALPLRAEGDAPEGDVGRPLVLTDCDLVEKLNGMTFEDLPLALRLRIRRSSLRMVVVRRHSSPLLRYEMFKRLNTGGSLLSPQEIRNCTSRMVGDAGTTFYEFLVECAELREFQTCIEPLSDSERNQKGDEELVLRFLALANARDEFAGSVRDWLDWYMDEVILERRTFDYDEQRTVFRTLFTYISEAMGPDAFVLHTDNGPRGGLKPAYFEAIAGGVLGVPLEALRQANTTTVSDAIVRVTRSDEFREVTGPGANTKPKLERRIGLIRGRLQEIIQ
ncbi:MAG TPA: hypothetical protein DGT21_03395 [Armatimonadetes bacterium]|jgi:hypothetical protein|nr:hypothetical protein [Armatimonadota bacterium]